MAQSLYRKAYYKRDQRERMGEEPPISTANINASIVQDERLRSLVGRDPDRILTFSGVTTRRDIVVIINRINDNFGPVHSTSHIADDVYSFKF